MKHLPNFLFVAAFVLLCSITAFAQGFVGTLKMEINSANFGDKPVPLTMSIKGDRSLLSIDGPKGNMSMYMNRSTEKMTMVMGGRNMGMEMDMKSADDAKSSDDKVTVTPTGEKSTINGYNVERYAISSTKSGESNWWMTKDLPQSLVDAVGMAFKHGTMGMSRGRKNIGSNPQIEALLKHGMLPVRLESIKDGKVESSVTFISFEEKKLDDGMFKVPDEVKIIQMPAGMAPGGQ